MLHTITGNKKPKNKPGLQKMVQIHSTALLEVASEMSLEELAAFAEINKSFADLLNPKIQERVTFGEAKKFPKHIVPLIGGGLNPAEQVSLAQVNRFFKSAMFAPLLQTKSQLRKSITTDVDNFFNNKDYTRGKFNHLMKKIFHIASDGNKGWLWRLIFSHAFDLDSKGASTHLFKKERIDDFSSEDGHYINLTPDNPNAIERFTPEIELSGGPKLSMSTSGYPRLTQEQFLYLSKIYRQYYPRIEADVIRPSQPGFWSSYDIHFDLEVFLRSVVPAMKGLSEKPSLDELADLRITNFLSKSYFLCKS